MTCPLGGKFIHLMNFLIHLALRGRSKLDHPDLTKNPEFAFPGKLAQRGEAMFHLVPLHPIRGANSLIHI